MERRGFVRSLTRYFAPILPLVSHVVEKGPFHVFEPSPTDIDIQPKQQSAEFANKVVEDVPDSSTATSNTSTDWKSLGVKLHETDESSHLPGKAGRRRLPCRMNVTWLFFIGFCFNSLAFAGVVASQDAKLLPTGQDLPDECSRNLKKRFDDAYNCPRRGYFIEHWERFNRLCCAGYGGTVLQCLEDYERGEKIARAACLPDQLVPSGKFVTMVVNETSYPYLLSQWCPPGYFRTGDVNASFLTFGYCNKKNQGDMHTMEEVCDSGPAAPSDRFLCKVGFQPNSHTVECHTSQGFSIGRCFCVPLLCEADEVAFRNCIITHPVPNCSSISPGSVWYGCGRVSSLPAQGTMPSITSSATASGDQFPPTSPPPEEGKDASFIVAVVVGSVVVLVLVLVLGIYWYCKKDSGSYHTRENGKPISGIYCLKKNSSSDDTKKIMMAYESVSSDQE